MTDFEEFRVVLTPELGAGGTWKVDIAKCPLPNYIRPVGTVNATMTRDQLRQLRSRTGWPDPARLRGIGDAVWNSVMSAEAAAAFEASLQHAVANDKNLRIVCVLRGDEAAARDPQQLQVTELPVEALYSDAHSYLATDRRTPVSRSLAQMPDRPPERTALPLRVLVLVATPTDKPKAEAANEAAALREVLDDENVTGVVEADIVENPTRQDLSRRLAQEKYHILHFIGHGGFGIVGNVATPRPHLCLVRAPDDLESHPIDAETLAMILRSTSVRLVVLTACSTAAPTPNEGEDPLGAGAFEGIAQQLVAGVSGVTAAVAMQFDLETNAAVEFSRSFYKNFLQPDLGLDEVVTQARMDLVTLLDAGHRAWITPVVYWRCEGGKVFEFEAARRVLDAEALAALRDVDIQLQTYRRQLDDIAAQPQHLQAAVDSLRQDWIRRTEDLYQKRGELLGESVRVVGCDAKPGENARCRILLRTRQQGRIDLVTLTIVYPPDILTYVASSRGDHAGPPAVAVDVPGKLRVILDRTSGDDRWPEGEYELGVIEFAVAEDAVAAPIDLQVETAEVRRNRRRREFATVDGVVFIEGSA